MARTDIYANCDIVIFEKQPLRLAISNTRINMCSNARINKDQNSSEELL